MTLAEYMSQSLMHTSHGYYQQEKIFGAEGDFTTAPEVSQMFGEVIGLWLADRWIHMGKPDPCMLVELGPGRGTLMADILRTTATVAGFNSAMQVHLVETSKQLKDIQRAKIPNANWHDTIDNVPEGPSLIIANEFFDALPIHQFERQKGIWLERRVTTSDTGFVLTLGPTSAAVSLITNSFQGAPNGAIIEVCPAALAVIDNMADRLKHHISAALIIDYGYVKFALGDTFQALRGHKYVDPLEDPGKADLTAHVNFESLANAASNKGITSTKIIEQGAFLMALGIGVRAEKLAGSAEGANAAEILAALKRLTSATEMGKLFKVLALQSPELPPAAGF